MNVLVVGGAGYVGGAVTDLLCKKSIPFSVYDNLLYESHYLKPNRFIFGDIRDKEKLKSILPEYTHCIWLSAIVGDGACQINPTLTKEVNQDSVQWLSENFIGRIILTSTCSVYGAGDTLLTENSPIKPLSIYAQTKLASENYLENKNSLILRLGTAFGVSDNYSRPRMDLALNYMTATSILKGEIEVFGGEQWRPMIHVKDIAEVIVNNLDTALKGIYNLASINIQIKDLGKKISEITQSKINFVEQLFEDKRNYRVSTEKAIQDKIFNPNILRSLEDGILEIKELIRLNRMKYSDNDLYSNEKHLANLLNTGLIETGPETPTLIPKLVAGNIHTDDRGHLTFFNEHNHKSVTRFYITENFSTETIRAWHGHKEEEKYIYIITGSAIVCAAKMSDNPKSEDIHRFILTEKSPKILHIPKGYANGVKALEPNTKIIFFSNLSLEKSKNDDYRFPLNHWDTKIWETKNQ